MVPFNILGKPDNILDHRKLYVNLASVTRPDIHNSPKRLPARSFKSSAVSHDKDKPDTEAKRLASDDPSQLPKHFFTSNPTIPPPIQLGFFRRKLLEFNMGALIAMTKDQFNPVEFLEGAKIAFTAIMDKFCKGSIEGFEEFMSPRILEGFAATVREYSDNHVRMDYEVGPIARADITSIMFLRDEGVDSVQIDVQFQGPQRFTLRDVTGRAVGEEGVWMDKSTVWRFQSKVSELRWVVCDLP